MLEREAMPSSAPKATVDPYAVNEDLGFECEKWSDKTRKEKIRSVVIGTTKFIFVLAALYLFICSLGLMGSSFQVLAGKTAGDIFSRNEILSNPVTGLIIGVLVTVLVQSSSTSTSIFITMTSVNLISVRSGIPLIMGANIGTSVTNTIVSLGQSTDREIFRKSFAGATVHDIFNILTVAVFLPLELISRYLERLTGAILSGFVIESHQKPPDLLKVLTKPLTKRIISVNKTVITYAATKKYLEPESSMVKIWCKYDEGEIERFHMVKYFNDTGLAVADNETELADEKGFHLRNESYNHTVQVGRKMCSTQDFLFANTGLSDPSVGTILLVVSLIAMCICLWGMVKLLTSLLRGNMARMIKKVINTDFPKPFGWLTGYLAILVGAGLTFLVQSSSVFTSSITPLVGMGVIGLERMYPLTLGSNIGTTTTGLLAALASSGTKLLAAVQLALCHFFFNISGILIWYPIPILRRVPIRAAKALGNKTAKHRWFALAYLFTLFFIVPAGLMGLSVAHEWALWSVLLVLGLILIAIVVISTLQSKRPSVLPTKMRDWYFLPLWMHSLKPYDRCCMVSCACCSEKSEEQDQESEQDEESKKNGIEISETAQNSGVDNVNYECEETTTF